MFEKLVFGCVKIEFFPWPCIDFCLYGHDSLVCELADVGAFWYVLPDEFVYVLNRPFLPRCVRVGEVDLNAEPFRYPLVARKLRSVVRRDGVHLPSPVWHHQPACLSCHFHRLLAFPEPCHEQEVGASLRQGEYGVLPCVDDEVHFPVPKARAVRLLRPLVYAHTASDVGSLGLVTVRRAPTVLHPVAAGSRQGAAPVGADHPVDGLMGDADTLLLTQIARFLAGRPLLVEDEPADAPEQLRRLRTVARRAVTA